MAYYHDHKLKWAKESASETLTDPTGYVMTHSAEEILGALHKTKKHSALEEDGLSCDILKQLRPNMQLKISEMLNEVFVTE